MPFIDKDFINDLSTRVDIVEIINKRVNLKKAGKDYKACCPFHNEKTPSFTVAPDKQIFHCFGCSESGSAIDFVMKHDHLDFVGAIETIANDFKNKVGSISKGLISSNTPIGTIAL